MDIVQVSTFLVEFFIVYIYGHFAEWLIHKDLLHRFGKKSKDLFSFHYRSHHYSAKKNSFKDDAYNSFIPSYDAAGKEIVYLLILVAAHVPVLIVSYGAFFAVLFSACEYYYKHRRAHSCPEWAKKNLIWHYDHHMGKNQDANWGVRSDFVDRLFKTRIKYF